MTATETTTYRVPGMTCAHCRAAIETEISKVPGVAGVEVDLDEKRVTVTGNGLDDAALRHAIDEAGYDAA